MSLSSLGVLAPHLSEENVERLLAQAEGKTKEEVKEMVAVSPHFSPSTCYGTVCRALDCVRADDPILTVQEARLRSDRRLFLARTRPTAPRGRCLVRNAGSRSEAGGRAHDQTKAGAPPGIS